MSFTIAFYIHHHGSGHLMRTLQVAKAIPDYVIILIGSGLKQLENLPEHIKLIHLPMDIADDEIETETERPVRAFHYAPLGIRGIRDRAAILTELFRTYYPMVLVVDVSAEVSLLARLAGVPTLIIRQHGNRTDLPHQLAYDSAEKLIAPYPASMYRGEKDEMYNKTVFTGGFSRFDGQQESEKTIPLRVCILVGAGGSSITETFLRHLAASCSDFEFHVLGLKQSTGMEQSNLHFHGQLNDPLILLQTADIIIGNTGHNTVMEVASLNKSFIGIPENRPFDEQLEKALSILRRSGIEVILPGDLMNVNWSEQLHQLRKTEVDWSGVIDPSAIAIMADTIIKTGEKFFYKH